MNSNICAIRCQNDRISHRSIENTCIVFDVVKIREGIEVVDCSRIMIPDVSPVVDFNYYGGNRFSQPWRYEQGNEADFWNDIVIYPEEKDTTDEDDSTEEDYDTEEDDGTVVDDGIQEVHAEAEQPPINVLAEAKAEAEQLPINVLAKAKAEQPPTNVLVEAEAEADPKVNADNKVQTEAEAEQPPTNVLAEAEAEQPITNVLAEAEQPPTNVLAEAEAEAIEHASKKHVIRLNLFRFYCYKKPSKYL